jgi:hypothetical protein
MTVGEIEPNQDDLAYGEPQAQDAIEIEDDQKPTFNKRQVSDVVKRERDRAYEKGRKEAMMQMQQQQDVAQTAPQQQAVQQQPMQQQGLGGMPQLSQEDVQRMIAEQAPQALQAQFQQLKQDHLINTFVGKMQVAEQKYPGLEAELNQLNYNDPRMHAFIEMANSFDNTGEIMKEVIDNPHKLTAILADVRDQPYIAQKQMQSLSKSIKQNEDAKVQDSQARDPMSQLKSSSTASVDDSQMSVSDYQKMFKNRR